jgi:hypothetical protein
MGKIGPLPSGAIFRPKPLQYPSQTLPDPPKKPPPTGRGRRPGRADRPLETGGRQQSETARGLGRGPPDRASGHAQARAGRAPKPRARWPGRSKAFGRAGFGRAGFGRRFPPPLPAAAHVRRSRPEAGAAFPSLPLRPFPSLPSRLGRAPKPRRLFLVLSTTVRSGRPARRRSDRSAGHPRLRPPPPILAGTGSRNHPSARPDHPARPSARPRQPFSARPGGARPRAPPGGVSRRP